MIHKVRDAKNLILLGVMAGLITCSFLILLIVQIYQPYKGYEESHQLIVIQRGSMVPQIARTLESHGIVRSSWLFEWYARLTHRPLVLQAGEYRFE